MTSLEMIDRGECARKVMRQTWVEYGEIVLNQGRAHADAHLAEVHFELSRRKDLWTPWHYLWAYVNATKLLKDSDWLPAHSVAVMARILESFSSGKAMFLVRSRLANPNTDITTRLELHLTLAEIERARQGWIWAVPSIGEAEKIIDDPRGINDDRVLVDSLARLGFLYIESGRKYGRGCDHVTSAIMLARKRGADSKANLISAKLSRRTPVPFLF